MKAARGTSLDYEKNHQKYLQQRAKKPPEYWKERTRRSTEWHRSPAGKDWLSRWLQTDTGRLYRRRQWLKQYGLTIEQHDMILRSQGGKCYICQRLPGSLPAGRALAIDHDHRTGRVRGILCQSCNAFLSLVDGEPQRLIRVARYLQRAKSFDGRRL